MSKTLLLLLLPILLSGTFATSNHKIPELEALRKEVVKDILSADIDEKQLAQLVSLMRPDGSWPDIDYTDKTRGGWLVITHLTRLNDMAVMHARQSGMNRNNSSLRSKILLGLNFWFENDFICPNWWYPEIGVPKVLGPTMILMEKYLNTQQITAGVKILNRSGIGMTGQNKVWLSGNVIYRSLITNELAPVQAAVAAIQNEIIVSEGEGIQSDNSFHQHGPQQQFGNYGLSFAIDMLKWGKIFQPTAYHFTEAKIAMLRGYLLNGMNWVIWKNKMDISSCGRHLFPGSQTGKAKTIANVYAQMESIDLKSKVAYNTALNAFDGNKHFWRSEMTVHRRSNFYASVKMSSSRVAGAESCNEENISGYHLGDGATYFYQSNEEYTDIFPYWDWKMLPGTTTFHDEMPLPVLPCNGYHIESDFAGGVSDGMNGIATLAYRRDSLEAQKSWFFFDDAMICLGAGIKTSLQKSVFTTINQAFLKTEVTGKSENRVQQFQNGCRNIAKTKWIIQDNWGYYFPASTSVSMSNQSQTGDWHKVLKRMPSEKLQAPLFKLWIDHGSAPDNDHYAYIVLPNSKASDIEKRGEQITVLANNDSLQASEIPVRQMAGFVFIRAGKASSEISGLIAVDKPCVILYTGKAITVADPAHRFAELKLSVAGNRKSKTVAGRYDAAVNSTEFTIPLPQKGESGKSFTFSLN